MSTIKLDLHSLERLEVFKNQILWSLAVNASELAAHGGFQHERQEAHHEVTSCPRLGPVVNRP